MSLLVPYEHRAAVRVLLLIVVVTVAAVAPLPPTDSLYRGHLQYLVPAVRNRKAGPVWISRLRMGAFYAYSKYNAKYNRVFAFFFFYF